MNFHSSLFFVDIFLASNIEWTMNDLLQLKKHQNHHQTGTKPTVEKNCSENKSSHTSVNHINLIHTETDINNTTTANNNHLGKLKEKSNHHKRPSISCEISSKRVKGHQDTTTIKATPQLLQQLMTTTGVTQKSRQKVQTQSSTETTATTSSRWTSNAQSKPHQPASNSVLMNLLVSGCDVSAGYTCLPRPKVAKA